MAIEHVMQSVQRLHCYNTWRVLLNLTRPYIRAIQTCRSVRRRTIREPRDTISECLNPHSLLVQWISCSYQSVSFYHILYSTENALQSAIPPTSGAHLRSSPAEPSPVSHLYKTRLVNKLIHSVDATTPTPTPLTLREQADKYIGVGKKLAQVYMGNAPIDFEARDESDKSAGVVRLTDQNWDKEMSAWDGDWVIIL